jgi:hypothetical protein
MEKENYKIRITVTSELNNEIHYNGECTIKQVDEFTEYNVDPVDKLLTAILNEVIEKEKEIISNYKIIDAVKPLCNNVYSTVIAEPSQEDNSVTLDELEETEPELNYEYDELKDLSDQPINDNYSKINQVCKELSKRLNKKVQFKLVFMNIFCGFKSDINYKLYINDISTDTLINEEILENSFKRITDYAGFINDLTTKINKLW